MTPHLPALLLALCVLLLAAGLGLVLSEAAGVRRMTGAVARTRRPDRSWSRAMHAMVAHRLGRNALALLTSKRRAEIQHRIEAAGRPGGRTLQDHAGKQAVSAVLFSVVGVVLAVALGNPVFVLGLAFIGWMQPDLSMLAHARRRQARIDRDLPDFLDVLAVTVSAGLGFRSALGRVADSLGGPLGYEIRTALQQMAYGVAPRAAFDGIRQRNDSESLAKFMSALMQAEDLGTPLSETLAAIADDMRKAFAQRARTEAARAVPRVSLIVTLVMVPGLMIILAGALIGSSGDGFGRILG